MVKLLGEEICSFFFDLDRNNPELLDNEFSSFLTNMDQLVSVALHCRDRGMDFPFSLMAEGFSKDFPKRLKATRFLKKSKRDELEQLKCAFEFESKIFSKKSNRKQSDLPECFESIDRRSESEYVRKIAEMSAVYRMSGCNSMAQSCESLLPKANEFGLVEMSPNEAFVILANKFARRGSLLPPLATLAPAQMFDIPFEHGTFLFEDKDQWSFFDRQIVGFFSHSSEFGRNLACDFFIMGERDERYFLVGYSQDSEFKKTTLMTILEKKGKK